MSCDNYDNAYYGACRPDVPYPSTSAESVPSLIDNLTAALYGTNLTKSVSNGRVVWTLPCNLATGYIPGFPPIKDSNGNITEGLLCYILRYLGQSTLAATVVYTGSVQTLTNKTLTSPIVTGGTFSSPALTTPTGIVATDIGGTAGTTGVLGAGITLAATQLTGGALPTNVTVANSNIISGTIAASRLNSIQDFTGKTFTLPSTTTLGASNTAGGLFYGATTSTLGQTASGTSGQVLISGGTGSPTWSFDRQGNTAGTATTSGNVGYVVDTSISASYGFSGNSNSTQSVGTWTVLAGDWEVSGNLLITYTGVTATVATAFGSSLSTNGSWDNTKSNIQTPTATTTQTSGTFTFTYSFPIQSFQVLSGTATSVTLLVRLPTFTAGTINVSGNIHARRAR